MYFPCIYLFLMIPSNNQIGISKNILTSSFDINPTFAVEILGIKHPCVNFGVGEDILALNNRDFIFSTKDNYLILIDRNNVSVYQRNGKVVNVNEEEETQGKPNLENLIRALRMLNRFRQ